MRAAAPISIEDDSLVAIIQRVSGACVRMAVFQKQFYPVNYVPAFTYAVARCGCLCTRIYTETSVAAFYLIKNPRAPLKISSVFARSAVFSTFFMVLTRKVLSV